MRHQPESSIRESSSTRSDERREAARVDAKDVPWIVAVRPNLGDVARLIDISRTGLLLDTRDRLLPGRKSIILLDLPGDRTERVHGRVVRSNLVGISPDEAPIYRAALNFTKELDASLFELPGGARETDLRQVDRLDGPIDGLWSTESGSGVTTITNLTETGCVARLTDPIVAGTQAMLTVFFSAVRRLLLAGQIVSVLPEGGCVLRFERLTKEQRRALRVELRSKQTLAPSPVSGLSFVQAVRDFYGCAESVHACVW